ncbi:SanA/YdcF family protein [Hanstruepera ponticola]|uniref:SanA/YdcF family protein n=1 Tax=Hanstruepera ponticola TaxID=2042995 RepID=UPI000CF05088|nr:ElyC/SanA/YdcF family protein [Hanstruepera ponticola]
MRLIKRLLILIICITVYSLLCSSYITSTAKNHNYTSIYNIPKNRVGIILGASKYTSNGRINLYYKYRLEAAVSLFNSGKIEYILISGDNGRKDYNEPNDFKIDLMKYKIPENKIFLDYAGFRTLDSMVRAKEIFGLESFTIISQKFHNERALFLAKHYDINAIAFNAKGISGRYGFKTRVREYIARTKASLDVLFNVKPKFLGNRIEIK